MSDLFATIPTAAAQAPTAAAQAPAARPIGWRAPTHPREHVCRGCAGVASCGIGDAWFCVPCVPSDFWPKGRG